MQDVETMISEKYILEIIQHIIKERKAGYTKV